MRVGGQGRRRTLAWLLAGGIIAATASSVGAAAPPEPNGVDDDPWAPRSRTPSYPLWPTAIDAVLGPLLDPSEDRESRLTEALVALEQLPDPLVGPALARSVSAKSVKVRRMAVQQCLDRDAQPCIAAATAQLEDETDPGLELMLLSVIARRPGTPELEALTAAAFSDEDATRQHAVMLLGQAPLPRENVDEVERALVAKLGDGVAAVRGEAARSLGLLRAQDSGLALVRLLDDPDPTVRGAAAESLGRLADPRTTNALTRALPRAGSAEIAAEIVRAIAMIPGEAADVALLAAFDDPPRHLSRKGVVEAIALRNEPSDALVDGFVRRLRDPSVREHALHALLGLGAAAVPRLQSATRRGLEPALALEVERLLAAVRPTAPGVADTSPSGDDPASTADPRAAYERAAAELFADDPRRRDAAALAVGGWLREHHADPAITLPRTRALLGRLERSPSAEAARPWLLVLLGAPPVPEMDPLVWTRLLGWARDPETPTAERCFCVLGLAAAPTKGPLARRTQAALEDLSENGDPELRACAAFAAVRRIATFEADDRVSTLGARRRRRSADALVESGLRDDAAHVRAHVALALVGWRDLSPHLRTVLVDLRATDRSVVVQAAANLALANAAADETGTTAPVSLTLPAWRDPVEGHSRWAPARVHIGRMPRMVWFPAPGGGEIVLGVVETADLPDSGSSDALPALEGILDDDTMDIHIDAF